MSFSSDQVTRLETLLAANVGAQSVNVDGQSVTYADLLQQYDYWKSRAAREQGTRPRVAQINLGDF
jgi:sulfur carrier protein ThiS